MKTSREIELERHITVLRDALQDAPHHTAIPECPTHYVSWYQQQRGSALESTDPNRWERPHVE